MALVSQVEQKLTMNKFDIIKYQIFTYCYVFNIKISEADLNCLTSLAMDGDQELTSFCSKICDNSIFSSSQSARNSITKCEKKGLIIKEGKNKKKIFINPKMKIVSKGNIFLNLKILSVES